MIVDSNLSPTDTGGFSLVALLMSSHQGASCWLLRAEEGKGREVTLKQRHEEGAGGERDTPIALSTQLLPWCHGAQWMMEHSHSELREH